jgi:hypothetical protein
MNSNDGFFIYVWRVFSVIELNLKGLRDGFALEVLLD